MIDPKGWSEAFATAVQAFGKLARDVRANMIGSLLTTIMLLSCYGFYHIMQTGEIIGGLRIAFFTTESQKASENAIRFNERMQVELAQVEKSNSLIRQQLRHLLAQYPDAARSRTAFIHNGSYSITNVPLLKWDVMHAEANEGYATGEMVVNQPLSQWADYMLDLVQGKCVIVKTSTITNSASRARLEALRIAFFSVCPIFNPNGQMEGALFLSWDDERKVPDDSPEQTALLYDRMKTATIQIAAAMEIRAQFVPSQ